MIRSLILCAATLAALATPANAAEVCGLDPNGDNYLAVREGPGSRFPELTRLGPSTYVDIIDVNASSTWFRVVADGEPTGWVSARYVCQ